jgi:outer membrane cobalamin receptor
VNFRFLPGLLAALAAVPVAAAEPPAGIPEIVVEASPVDRVLSTRTDLPSADLDNLGKSDLADVIDFVPGTNVRTGGRGEPRVDVRGFDQRATLFTLDGVPLYEPYNGIINFNLFPAELLDGVTLTRGATSSLYGPNGMAGAVHLRTRRAAGLLARGSTTWRDSNFWDARASATESRGPFSLLLGGRYLDSAGFPLSGDFADRPPSRQRFEDGGRRRNSDRQDWSAFANGGYRLDDTTTLRATVIESHAEFGIPPRTTSFTPDVRRVDRQNLTHVHVAGDESDWLGNDVGLAMFYSGYDTRETERDAEDVSVVRATTEVDSDEVGGIVRGSRAIGSQLTAAVASQVRQAWADVEGAAPSDADFTTFSFASEGQYAATANLSLVAGVSADVQTGGGRGTEWEPNPQIGAAYAFGHWGTARASVSRKTRFPTLRELFDPVQGNDDLEAEKSWSYEIGFQTELFGVGADVALFRADVDDLIESSGGRNGEPSPAENLADAVLQGVEVAFDWRPFERLGLRANYTFLDAKADNPLTDDGGDMARIAHRPKHRVNAIAEVILPYEIGARVETQYTAEQVDRFGTSVTLDDAFVLNLQASRDLARWLTLLAGADNLLDEDYEEALGMPRPGRWVFVGVRVHADEF